ncbi:hypothetical protein CCO03_08710 [Comamonas serinivorans]|uniref:Uncharacterized protein n=1 Tax=Comamonas serinivorans TaxID=1082851 RepID=A0A1Y0EMC3_9BURK|nr:hypothetical protein [Comamonas serinivorans]ARU04746.1 hypothetical protein CCO03_08710 [Comamonas serinivorans]
MNLPIIIFLLLSATGLGLFVAGAAILAGLGWALLAGSAACLVAAAFLKKGLAHE